MANPKQARPATGADILTRVAEGLAAIIGDEITKKQTVDEAKADLDNATARGIRALRDQFELLRGLNSPIGEVEQKTFLDTFETGLIARGANEATAKARKSDVKTMLVQRHNLARTLDLVDELKAEVAASDLERKPSINVRTTTLRVLRTLKQREADVQKGKPGVRLSSPEEEIDAIRKEIFAEKEEGNTRDELLSLLTRVEEHPLLQVAGRDDAFVPHPAAASAVATIRKLIMEADDALRASEAASLSEAEEAEEAEAPPVADDPFDLVGALGSEGVEEAEEAEHDLAGVLDGVGLDGLGLDDPAAPPPTDSLDDFEAFTKGILD